MENIVSQYSKKELTMVKRMEIRPKKFVKFKDEVKAQKSCQRTSPLTRQTEFSTASVLFMVQVIISTDPTH
jgi:hypothetical protein